MIDTYNPKEEQLKKRVSPHLWYKYFYTHKELKFDIVQFPKVNRVFLPLDKSDILK